MSTPSTRVRLAHIQFQEKQRQARRAFSLTIQGLTFAAFVSGFSLFAFILTP